MAYTKTVWTDEVLAGAERFNINDNAGTPIHGNVEIELNTAVTTPGTSIDADALNNIENGIDAISKGAARSVKGVASAAGDVADIAAANDHEVLRRSGTGIGFGKVANAGLVDHSELVYLKLFWADETVESGEGKLFFTVPPYLNGGTIVKYDIAIYTPSTAGLVTVNTHNLATSKDVLSTPATIDEGEFNSMTAATPPVIANGALLTGQRLRFDVSIAGTNTKGLDIMLEVEKL